MQNLGLILTSVIKNRSAIERQGALSRGAFPSRRDFKYTVAAKVCKVAFEVFHCNTEDLSRRFINTTFHYNCACFNQQITRF